MFLTTLALTLLPIAPCLSFMATDSPDVDADGAVKFQCLPAAGRLGISEHNTYFHSYLVDEDKAGLAFTDNSGKFSQGLAHQPCLKPDVACTHFAFEFGLWCQSCDRINYDNIDRI